MKPATKKQIDKLIELKYQGNLDKLDYEDAAEEILYWNYYMFPERGIIALDCILESDYPRPHETEEDIQERRMMQRIYRRVLDKLIFLKSGREWGFLK